MEQGIAFEHDYLALNYTRGVSVSSVQLARAAAETASHIAAIEADEPLPSAQGPEPGAAAPVAPHGTAAARQQRSAHHFFGADEGEDAAGATSPGGGQESLPPPGGERRAIFQATFVDGGAVAKADVIEYVGGGEWDVVEVKSSSDRHAQGYLLDLSYTVYVATRAGLNVRGAYLVAAASSFRFGMPRAQRFARLDLTDKVFGQMGCVFA
jgi:hypothetical protein